MSVIFDNINDATGYANGNEFASEQEVRDYFTVDSWNGMFNRSGDIKHPKREKLTAWAEKVIANKSHCNFTS